MPYVPHTPEQTQEMLDLVGLAAMEDLFADIPLAMRPKSFDLPSGLNEMEICRRFQQLAARNKTDLVCFLGAGFYDHYQPKALDNLLGRGEFYTAYTPYQPEASQGTLQAIFEYQTAITRLLDMDCANASVYDGGSAIFEAAMMAVRSTRRRKLVISETLNPIYRIMLSSYTSHLNIELITVPHARGQTDISGLMRATDEQTAAVVVQNPNFFGLVTDYSELFAHARSTGTLSIALVYPVLQAVLKTPGEMGADIAVAEGQSLGLPLSFGGPYLGIMACKRAHIRQLPGRIVGRTEDGAKRTGYVLTLQAREQHIRRAKATSNICSNQALCALRALVHLCLRGPEGLKRTAELSIERAHYAARRLCALPGVALFNNAPFANEFALSLPFSASEAANRLAVRGYVPGFPIGRYYAGLENVLLVACTEKISFEDVGILTEMIGGLL